MAYVGTVALHDATGAVLVTRRFAASAGEGPARLVERVLAEVAHVRAARPGTPVVIVQDGAPELWTLLDAAFARHAIVPTHRLIDRYHVDERLAAAIEIMAADAPSARHLRERWRAALDRSDTAIGRITRDLARIDWALGIGAADGDRVPAQLAPLLRKHLPAARQRAFTGHVEYLQRQRARLCYATARRRGFPIGSGVTEGACKSVVALRCKRSGQRWSDPGLQGCLGLRALLLSDRLPQTFALLQQAQVREIRAVG